MEAPSGHFPHQMSCSEVHASDLLDPWGHYTQLPTPMVLNTSTALVCWSVTACTRCKILIKHRGWLCFQNHCQGCLIFSSNSTRCSWYYWTSGFDKPMLATGRDLTRVSRPARPIVTTIDGYKSHLTLYLTMVLSMILPRCGMNNRYHSYCSTRRLAINLPTIICSFVMKVWI